MSGAGDMLDIFHVILQAAAGQFGVDQVDQKFVITIGQLVLLQVQFGDPDKSVWPRKAGVQHEDSHHDDKHPQDLAAYSHVGVRQPGFEVLLNRIQK